MRQSQSAEAGTPSKLHWRSVCMECCIKMNKNNNNYNNRSNDQNRNNNTNRNNNRSNYVRGSGCRGRDAVDVALEVYVHAVLGELIGRLALGDALQLVLQHHAVLAEDVCKQEGLRGGQ